MRALRWLAVAIALAGLVDPSMHVRRSQPLPVELRVEASSPSIETAAVAVRDLLLGAVGGDVDLSGARAPAAVIVIGDRLPETELPAAPVSTVHVTDGPRQFEIARVDAPAQVALAQVGRIRVEIACAAAAAGAAVVTLEHDGAEIASTEGSAAVDEPSFVVDLPFVPLAAGVAALRVTVRASAANAPRDSLDFGLPVTDRRTRIAVLASRPSWALTYVRRALEEDPAFDVVSLVRTSTASHVRVGDAPEALRARDLDRFDAVLVGAPEALDRPDVQALSRFARDRGGAVLLLADRRPSGPVLSLLPATPLSEVLLDRPTALTASNGLPSFRASELALATSVDPATVVLAALRERGASRPVVVWRPLGAGRVLFSGALDAWRTRDADGEAFGRFWRQTVAEAAVAAPGLLQARAEPALVRPGEAVRITAAIRGIGSRPDGARAEVPPVSAEIGKPDGSRSTLRLWPAARLGVYEARLVPAVEGVHRVRVEMPGADAEASFIVREAAVRPAALQQSLAVVSEATGGVAATPDALDTVTAHLRALPPLEGVQVVHPMRSPWWLLPFAGALCVEWYVRRRRGGS